MSGGWNESWQASRERISAEMARRCEDTDPDYLYNDIGPLLYAYGPEPAVRREEEVVA